jgi:hypothetical protein
MIRNISSSYRIRSKREDDADTRDMDGDDMRRVGRSAPDASASADRTPPRTRRTRARSASRSRSGGRAPGPSVRASGGDAGRARRARSAAEPPIMLKDAGPVGVHDSVAHEALDMTSIATGWRPPTDADGAVVRSRTAPQSSAMSSEKPVSVSGRCLSEAWPYTLASGLKGHCWLQVNS